MKIIKLYIKLYLFIHTHIYTYMEQDNFTLNDNEVWKLYFTCSICQSPDNPCWHIHIKYAGRYIV